MDLDSLDVINAFSYCCNRTRTGGHYMDFNWSSRIKCNQEHYYLVGEIENLIDLWVTNYCS